MFGFETVVYSPRINNRSFLNVELFENIVQFRIVATFVAAVPNYDGRVIYIARNQFFNQLGSGWRVVLPMSTRQFVQHKKAK
jgi:hypothetical protein